MVSCMTPMRNGAGIELPRLCLGDLFLERVEARSSTCWLTIGWKTRWPMLPIGPATWMSASQRMLVRSPSG